MTLDEALQSLVLLSLTCLELSRRDLMIRQILKGDACEPEPIKSMSNDMILYFISVYRQAEANNFNSFLRISSSDFAVGI